MNISISSINWEFFYVCNLKNTVRLIVTIFTIISSNLIFASSTLYPGETLLNVNNYQTLIKFIKGDPKKPLVIFIPGDSHLARISYGYPGADPKDFLSYWIHEKGYSFLGISYPMDNPVFSRVYPAFSIQDWGQQVAETAKKVVEENKLSNHVIVLGWSMGGSIEEAINVAAKKRKINVDLFIGLSAVPPLPYVMQSGPFDTNKMLPNKLADRKALIKPFVTLLKEQDQYNKHEIIPEKIYLAQFLGNIPTAIAAEGYHYQNGRFIYNVEKTLQDGGVFNFLETPWIALIQDDSPTVAKIALIDPASWNFLRAEMIYKNYLQGKKLADIPPQNWNTLINLINNLPEDLTLRVHGNHFFFVGQTGAKATAEDIDILFLKIIEIKKKIISLIS